HNVLRFRQPAPLFRKFIIPHGAAVCTVFFASLPPVKMTVFICGLSCAVNRLVSGCAFGFQHFHHLVGGGGGRALLEVAGNHKDGVPPAYLGHAIRAAGGSGGASVGGVGHRLSFLFSSVLSCSIFSLA